MSLRCDGYAEEKLRRAVRRSFCCVLLRGDPENAKKQKGIYFNREFACKQSIHIEIWQVLNRYTKRNTVPMG